MLMPTGMSRADARKAVADVLTRKGISPAGSTRKISERTIRKWEDDIGIDATATKMLRSVEAGVLEDVSAIVTRAARQPPENYSPNGAPNSEDQPATDSDIRHVFLSALSDFAAIHGRRRTT
jgi:hypothetical protein